MFAVTTATVSAPIDKVWSVVADHEGMAKWGPGRGLNVTLTQEGSPDRNGVGAVRRLAPAVPGPAIVEQITVFEPNKRLQYKALAGVPLKDYFGDIELHEIPNGTEIVYRISATERVKVVEQLACKAISFTLLKLLVQQINRG
ncbi:SRPBCC family protein [Smaragdicoccus niigatensis]|uniref:SRPBCC family protein n=1 Tax=Smaragdicoccus niigatensis TaxID=359359 RepID=UPI00036AD200|nr:SRPBCC family protein [Smaragdicoccus niigatensis]